MQPLLLMDSRHMSLVIDRLCHQLIENHDRFGQSAIIGLQPRGIYLAQRLVSHLGALLPDTAIRHGILDITFFRDDFRRTSKPLLARDTQINFSVEGLNIILVDDVLYTGRSIRAGMEALLEFGRPNSVELMVFIDRRFSRQLPIEPNYTGQSVDSYNNQKVRVLWKEQDGADKVVLLTGEGAA